MYPDMAKLQSNHRFYKSDTKLAIEHSDTNYKTTTLTWSKTLEATHGYNFAFLEYIYYNMAIHAIKYL